MFRSRSFRAAAIFVGLMVPAQALALEFVTVGPRAIGMGGAGVAITTDSLATYWNPAGLAMTQTVDVRIQGGGQVIVDLVGWFTGSSGGVCPVAACPRRT